MTFKRFCVMAVLALPVALYGLVYAAVSAIAEDTAP